MSDIVERLRAMMKQDCDDDPPPRWCIATGKCSCAVMSEAATEIERLRMAQDRRRVLDNREWGVIGCPVCGLGADGQPMAYACQRSDCPTRATA